MYMKKVISYRQIQVINKAKKFFIQLPAELKVVFGQGLRGEDINLNSVSPNQQSNLKKIKNIIKYVQNSESQTQTNTIYNELLALLITCICLYEITFFIYITYAFFYFFSIGN